MSTEESGGGEKQVDQELRLEDPAGVQSAHLGQLRRWHQRSPFGCGERGTMQRAFLLTIRPAPGKEEMSEDLTREHGSSSMWIIHRPYFFPHRSIAFLDLFML